jgi:hypothetical protein
LLAFQRSDWAIPSGTIIGVEEELRGRLAPDAPEILARIDLIVETGQHIIITDFKSARGADRDSAPGSARTQDAAPGSRHALSFTARTCPATAARA